jgi:SAM-dependent methyltransferase
MSWRIRTARFLFRVSNLFESLPLMVMRPDDLVEFSRQMYARPQNVAAWGSDDVVQQGLDPDEQEVLEKLPSMQGRLLLLDVGGGREAIPLAQAGFSVTGVDFVPEMIEQAKANAEKAGVRLEGLVQEISSLDVAPESYDVAWLWAAMYSCVPTRRRRLAMLKRIHGALRPGGYFLCQFQWGGGEPLGPRRERLKRAFALLTRGNLTYEPGDMLYRNIEFIHGFRSEAELRAEFAVGGFKVEDVRIYRGNLRGDAVLRRV